MPSVVPLHMTGVWGDICGWDSEEGTRGMGLRLNGIDMGCGYVLATYTWDAATSYRRTHGMGLHLTQLLRYTWDGATSYQGTHGMGLHLTQVHMGWGYILLRYTWDGATSSRGTHLLRLTHVHMGWSYVLTTYTWNCVPS